MYTTKNFRTKKALKEAVADGERVTVWQPGPFAKEPESYTGSFCVEGPQYPEPHRWYATVEVVAGVVTKVK